MEKIMAGIVTYNMDVPRLINNIESICNQVEEVLIVDNASSNYHELEYLQERYKLSVIYNKKNMGIAYALNQILEWAYKKKMEWVVTLDQDSVCPLNYIEQSFQLVDRYDKKIGQIVPVIYEDNCGMYCYMNEYPNGKDSQVVSRSITSAAITNVYAWHNVKGFDSKLFIDYVDYDYALKLKRNGYKIIRLNNITLKHCLGESETKRFLFKNIRVSKHSVLRKYFITRNMIVFIRRYWKDINLFEELARLTKMVIFTICFEQEKIKKMRAIVKGFVDGLKYEK